MTGPEHYRRAERLMRVAADPEGLPAAQHAALVATAQVHATLALAAATFTGGGCGSSVDSTAAEQWREAIS